MGELRWPQAAKPGPASGPTKGGLARRVAVIEGALGGVERLASLAALFPHVEFETISSNQSSAGRGLFDVIVIAIMAEKAEAAIQWLHSLPKGSKAVVILHEADVLTTRRLMREGAADVLPAPASEPTIALSLERLFTAPLAASDPSSHSEVVALLKAGGGVGATSLGVQATALLAARECGQVCFADLDLQFGAGAAYFDLPDAISIVDCLSAGASLADTPFASALGSHKSGARLLAAPQEIVGLESVSPLHVDALIQGLRRDAALTIVDLPGAWTTWTNEVLRLSDRIVIVTHLTVPHIQMVKRLTRMLALQQLDHVPVLLVCNALSRDQQASLSVKAAERALGQDFDVLIPEDRRTMTAAINQGVLVGDVRRGTALEKAISLFAGKIAAEALAEAPAKRSKK